MVELATIHNFIEENSGIQIRLAIKWPKIKWEKTIKKFLSIL